MTEGAATVLAVHCVVDREAALPSRRQRQRHSLYRRTGDRDGTGRGDGYIDRPGPHLVPRETRLSAGHPFEGMQRGDGWPSRSGRALNAGRTLCTGRSLRSSWAGGSSRTHRTALARFALRPCGPAAPAGPTGPCGPAGPAPPGSPLGPGRPGGPAAPVSPFGPCGPMGPTGPWSPSTPCWFRVRRLSFAPQSASLPTSRGMPFSPLIHAFTSWWRSPGRRRPANNRRSDHRASDRCKDG